MRLVADDAVHDVGAGLLQLCGELDVVRLVKARTQLDDRRHLLARARRFDQRIDHGRVPAGSVERLLDRQHARIARGLPHELDHGRERVERVVQQKVALAQHLEQVRATLLHAPGNALDEGRVLEVGPLDEIHHRHQPVHVDRAVHAIQVALVELELAQQETRGLLWTRIRHLEPHRLAKIAIRELALERAHQVVGLFLVDPQVAVARHAELVAALDLHARERLAHVRVHHRREQHEVEGPGRDAVGQLDQARQRARHLHDGRAALASVGVVARHGHDEIERLVVDARKRMRRVEPHRRQHRQDLVGEVALDPRLLALVPVGALEQPNALALERGQEHLVQQPVLLRDERVSALADAAQRLGVGHAVRLAARDAMALLLAQPGHANLEELVEVRAADREEAHALEQRRRRVLGLLEDAGVELQLRQFPVQVQRRIAQVRRNVGSHGNVR